MAYIDTSVLAAYYCPEKLSAAVQAELARDKSPTISPLVEVELCSAVALKVRIGELRADAARQVISLFQLHIADGRYDLIPITTREYALARDWISRLTVPLRTLDALHLAAAFARGITFLTSDKLLARAAGQLGVAYRLLG
ncbi:MAG: type II toxin-antitoxin system VapC family toxin [Tepidisphaeraceae bacterium]|jgi:hypothetical protein